MNELNNIPEDFDDLKKHAPFLASLEKKNIFQTPANYFDELPQLVQSRVFVEEIKQAEAEVPEGYFDALPSFIQSHITLEQYKTEENPFAVPADYFDYLPARIQERIIESKRNRLAEWVSSLFATPGYLVPATLSVVILIMGIVYLNSSDSIVKQPMQLSQVEKNEVINNAGTYNIDESAIAEELTGDASSVTETSVEADAKDIADYLTNENVDVNSLIKDI